MKKYALFFLLIVSLGFYHQQAFGQSIAPFVFSQLSTQFVNVGSTLTIPVEVSGLSDKTSMVISNVSGLPGLKVEHLNNLGASQQVAAVNLTWTPSNVGRYTCQVTAKDLSSGSSMTKSFDVVVNAPGVRNNASPIIHPIPIKYVNLGSTVVIPVGASRPNGVNTLSSSVLSLSIDGLPEATVSEMSSNVTDAHAVVTWQTPNMGGVYMLNISVSDGYGAKTMEEIPILVGNDMWGAVSFEQLPNQFLGLNQNGVIPVTVKSINPNSQLVILSVAGLPGVNVTSLPLASNATNAVAAANLTWASSTPGLYTCLVTVFDKVTGTIVTQGFLVNVLNVASAVHISPIIASIGSPQTDVLPDSVNIPISVSRLYPSTTYAVSMYAYGLPGLKLLNVHNTSTGLSGIVSWNVPSGPGTDGPYYLNVVFRDTNGVSTMEQLPITVGNPGSPQIFFDPLSTQFANVGHPLSINIKATSLTGTSVAILSVAGLPGASLTALNTGNPVAQASISWTPVTQGFYYCQITAQEQKTGNIISASFIVLVNSANGYDDLSPTLNSIPLQMIPSGEQWNLNINAFRSRGTGSVLMLDANGLPGLTISNVNASTTQWTGNISWRASAPGKYYSLHLSISDGNGAYTVIEVPVVVI